MVLRLFILFIILNQAITRNVYASFFAKASYITWNKSLTLDRDNNSNVELYSIERGPCLGGGYDYKLGQFNFMTSACLAPMTATISEAKETGVNLNQHNVHINSYLIQNKIYWTPKEDTKIGLGIPLAYRTGEYGSIADGSIQESNLYDFGYELSLAWKIKNTELDMSIGSLNSFESSYWIIGLNYYFDKPSVTVEEEEEEEEEEEDNEE